MASLTKCIRTHRAALEAADIDIDALKTRVVEMRQVDGDTADAAARSAVEELLAQEEEAWDKIANEITRQGGQVPAQREITSQGDVALPGAPEGQTRAPGEPAIGDNARVRSVPRTT